MTKEQKERGKERERESKANKTKHKNKKKKILYREQTEGYQWAGEWGRVK